MATEHVNGNGTEEPMDTTSAVIHSENFQTLLDAGLPQKVAEKLDEIYVAGLVAHSDLDERAIEALKEFNEDGALAVLQQFKDSDLSHVQNKSAFLCGVMKTYRQREKQGTKVADSSKGPDEAKIKALLERTGYTLDVTTGQRKYGGHLQILFIQVSSLLLALRYLWGRSPEICLKMSLFHCLRKLDLYGIFV